MVAEPVRDSLWSCGTTAGHCIVRIVGLQKALLGEPDRVVFLAATTSGGTLHFSAEIVRSLTLSGFLRRYRPVDRPEAEAQAYATSLTKQSQAEPTVTSSPHDPRQVEMSFNAAAAATPDPKESWDYDAIVLNAGICGGLALRAVGLRPLAVDLNHDSVSIHERVAGPAVVGNPIAWCPSGTARLVLALNPSTLVDAEFPLSSSEMEGADEPDEQLLAIKDPRRKSAIGALRTAHDCGAKHLLLEVRGGGRGSIDLLTWIEQQASDYEFSTRRIRVDPAYWGLPQTRPTDWLLCSQVELKSVLPIPKFSHGPRGNLVGLPPFSSVREALGLSGNFVGRPSSQPPGAAKFRDAVDVEGPANTIRCLGLAERLYPEVGVDQEPVAVPLTVDQIARLQGVPPEVLSCGQKLTMKQVASVVPPMMIEKLVRALGLAPAHL